MFGLGFWEIAIILAIALIVLGPSKLPELARGLGKGLREFRKATEDFKATVEEEVNRPDASKKRLPSDPRTTLSGGNDLGAAGTGSLAGGVGLDAGESAPSPGGALPDPAPSRGPLAETQESSAGPVERPSDPATRER